MTGISARIEQYESTVLARQWRGEALAFVALAGLIAMTRAVWFGDPVADFDEQLYSFIGWRLQFGELPYVDWWDRKPFGLFAIFGISHLLLGQGPLAYQLVGTAFTAATAWLVFHLSRKLVGTLSATIASALTIILMAAYANYSGQSEIFFTPLMLGMVALLLDSRHPQFTRRAALAMLLGGLALQVKYTVLPQCIFLGVYAIWCEYRARPTVQTLVSRGTLFLALGLLPTAIVASFYAAIGEFDAYVFANFISFFDRLPSGQDRFYAGHLPALAPLIVTIMLAIYAAFRLCRPQPFGTWLFYCGWALSVQASVMLPQTIYLYYYAAMAAPVALVALPLLDRRGPLKAIPGLLLVLAMFSLLNLPVSKARSSQETRAATQLAEAIAPHVGPSENCLWLWDGPTALYRMTGSCVPTRFVYPDHLNNALEKGALGVDQTGEVARILDTRPGAIVTASRPMTFQNEEATALVEAALAQNYVEDISVEMHNRTLTVWIRRD